MKLNKKIFAFILACLMLASGVIYAETNYKTMEPEVTTEEECLAKYDSVYYAKQEESGLNYIKLMESFIDSRAAKIVYPEYYGGSYVDDDGNLNIYIKGNDSVKIDSTNNIAKAIGTRDYIVKNAKYSYNELENVMNTLNAFLEKEPESAITKNFPRFYLSDRDNNVIVELEDMSDEQIDLFKKNVLDSPIITFKKSTGVAVKEAQINPGQRIKISANSTDGSGSVGYRARRNGNDGFVTAAHVGTSTGMDMYIGTTVVGRVTARQESGPVDACFVRATNLSEYVPSNILHTTSDSLSTLISSPGVGTVINKRGIATGATTGRVLSTNVTETFDGIRHTNLTSADYYSFGGDSGGIVYSYISSTNTRMTLGIHMAANGSTRYYVKANEINSALGTTRY